MTILSCRNRETRLHVAYIIDAVMHKSGNSFDTTIEPLNSIKRIRSEQPHPYSQMWDLIARFYKRLGWNDLCDPEIDDLWQTAISVGLTVGGVKLTPQDVLFAKQRWHKSNWYRYEFKRTNRRIAVAPWLRIGMVGV